MNQITLGELKKIRDYAYLSAFAYHNGSPNYPNLDKNWKKTFSFADFFLMNKERLGVPCQPAVIPCYPDDYDVHAEIFINDVTKELAIVYRGTVNLQNLIDSIMLFFNCKTLAEGTLVSFVNYARFKINADLKYNILHIGHSLGGYLASLFALKKNERCYAFDAPSVKTYVEQNYPDISEDHFKNVTYIDSNWSLVHNFPGPRSQKARIIPFQVDIKFSELECNLHSTVFQWPLARPFTWEMLSLVVYIGSKFAKQVHGIDNIVKAIEQSIFNKENNIPEVLNNPIYDALHFKIKPDIGDEVTLEMVFKLFVENSEPNNVTFRIDPSSFIHSTILYCVLSKLTMIVSVALKIRAIDLESLNLHFTHTGRQTPGSSLVAGGAQNSEALFYDFHLVVKGENIGIQASVGGGGSVTITADLNRKCLIASTPDIIGPGYWAEFRLRYGQSYLIAGLICKAISVCELEIDMYPMLQEFAIDADKDVAASFKALNEKIHQNLSVISKLPDSGKAGVFNRLLNVFKERN